MFLKYQHSSSYIFSYVYKKFALFYNIYIYLNSQNFLDMFQIPKPSHKCFLPWGFVFLAFCQVSQQSEEKLPAETHHQPDNGTAADASKVAPCGGMWVELGREIQTFWFYRGDRPGRSSDVSRLLIFLWTWDNYGTILIHELLWDVLSIYEHYSWFFT